MTMIIGLKVRNRIEFAKDVQEKLTKYGSAIKTRLGLNMFGECSECGLILLEIIQDDIGENLINELQNIKEIEVQKMIFEK